MNKSILTILLFYWWSMAVSQDLSAWGYQVTEKANTAVQSGYLTASEKKIILLMNLARTDGPKFYETIAKPFLGDAPPSSYSRSLTQALKKTQNLQVLSPQKDLYEAALKHATEMGKSGKVGHYNYIKRMGKLQTTYNGLGENCDYGSDDPLTIVMRLLIDEGNPDYGHRKAILAPEFYYVGVSLQPHSKWNFNCVQEFGGQKAK